MRKGIAAGQRQAAHLLRHTELQRVIVAVHRCRLKEDVEERRIVYRWTERCSVRVRASSVERGLLQRAREHALVYVLLYQRRLRRSAVDLAQGMHRVAAY